MDVVRLVKVFLHLSGNIMQEHDDIKNILEERVNEAKYLKKQGVSQFRIVQILKVKQLVTLLLIAAVMTVFT